MYFFVGRCFFPLNDGGQIQLHVRAPPGPRSEKTEQIFEAVENKIRDIIPTNERELIVDNIGLQARLYNLAFAADRAHNGVRREIGKRPMARDTSAAALALHRSGLGPRAGAIESLASDPQSALMAELA